MIKKVGIKLRIIKLTMEMRDMAFGGFQRKIHITTILQADGQRLKVLSSLFQVFTTKLIARANNNTRCNQVAFNFRKYISLYDEKTRYYYPGKNQQCNQVTYHQSGVCFL